MNTRNLSRVLLTAICISTWNCFANNINVTNATLNGQVAASDYTYILFDLTWGNSWRTSTGPSNYDGAWIFVKFKIDGGGCTATKWQHATLSTTGTDHSITTDNGTAGTLNPSSDGKGIFLYRSGDGSGNINWQQVKLRWNYGTDGVADGCDVTIKVMAIEMVYVPTAAFYAGDGTSTNGQFETAVAGTPFNITSEATPATLGGGGAGSMGNNNANGQGYSSPLEDFDDATSVALPGAFPKGYAAFWCMKYECSQEQWKEFLNCLTGDQQLLGGAGGAYSHGPETINYYMNSTAGGGTYSLVNTYRNGIMCKIAPSAAVDGEYVCNYDGDASHNETDADGRFIAVNNLNPLNIMAYLDWAALRMMTELEYEKACRGTLTPVANEYAWGTNVIGSTGAYSFSNAGLTNESSNYATLTTAGSLIYSGKFTIGGASGPGRCGMFAAAASTRVQAGASYYGIMELSGNVMEPVVGLSSVAGRSYTALHGDGTLTTNGYANVDYWPGANGNNDYSIANGVAGTGNFGSGGFCWRGGAFNTVNTVAQVSDRYYNGGWGNFPGIRGVRTAW